MSEELKPCPFCGCNQIIEGTETDNTCAIPMTVWFVKCAACGTSKSSISNSYRAKKRWNTRPAEDALKAEVNVLKAKVKRIKNLIKFRRDVVLDCIKQGITPSAISEYTALNCIIEDINTEQSFDAPDTNVGNNEVKDE